MSTFENLSFPQMMGNLASELTRVQRVANKGDLESTDKYMWEALTLAEIIKHKYPHKESTRLFEYLAQIWVEKTEQRDIPGVTKYALDFYLNSLS